jgi:hypothetical protein
MQNVEQCRFYVGRKEVVAVLHDDLPHPNYAAGVVRIVFRLADKSDVGYTSYRNGLAEGRALIARLAGQRFAGPYGKRIAKIANE